MSKFAKLGLKKEVLIALDQLGFDETFEVQEKVVPIALSGSNVVFTSKTGSGKTLAYLLGFISKIKPKQGLQMIVFVPTRELCVQVCKEMRRVCDLLGINVGMLYGGRPVPGDVRTLTKKNQIIVGTPGRLLLHVNEKSLKVGEVKYLVYDESDQMFDNGFYEDCVYIKKRVSKLCQIVFSSATRTPAVENFVNNVIVDYKMLEIGELIPSKIKQEKIYCEKIEKNLILLELFKKKVKRTMIFCNTKLKVKGITKFLNENGHRAKELSSDLDQNKRLNTLNLFKEGKITLLVTTDVAARGLHIENVDRIINYDVPTRDEFYVHRIGRTGRNNTKGYSLTMICPEDVERFELIEFQYQLNIKEIKKPVKLGVQTK